MCSYRDILIMTQFLGLRRSVSCHPDHNALIMTQAVLRFWKEDSVRGLLRSWRSGDGWRGHPDLWRD